MAALSSTRYNKELSAYYDKKTQPRKKKNGCDDCLYEKNDRAPKCQAYIFLFHRLCILLLSMSLKKHLQKKFAYFVDQEKANRAMQKLIIY